MPQEVGPAPQPIRRQPEDTPQPVYGRPATRPRRTGGPGPKYLGCGLGPYTFGRMGTWLGFNYFLSGACEHEPLAARRAGRPDKVR
jgi:hypothetical protein